VSDAEGAGQRLGSLYVLDERIGSGGMGTVWRGRNTETGELVAVKMLADNLSQDRDLVARFLQERAALTGVHHPNLVEVRDLVAERDRLGLVMDLVQGMDAGRALASGPLSPARVCRIGYEVCQALAAIHAGGIVHRDLKPANILLDERTGSARLADFGIALLAGSTRLTAVNSVVGTPRYLAPELLTGGSAGPHADVYALGICVYELLTGGVPFNGEHYAQILQQHINAEPPAHPAIPPNMWPMIQRMLAKNPAERPTTVALGGWFFSLLSEFGAAGTVGPGIWPSAAPSSQQIAVRPDANMPELYRPSPSGTPAPHGPQQTPGGTPVVYQPQQTPGGTPIPYQPQGIPAGTPIPYQPQQNSGTPVPGGQPPSNTMMMGYTARSAGTPSPSSVSNAQSGDSPWNNQSPPSGIPQFDDSGHFSGPPLSFSQGPFTALPTVKRRGKRKIWISVAGVVAVAGAGIGVFLATQHGGGASPKAAGTSTASVGGGGSATATPVTGALTDRWAMAGTARDLVGTRNGRATGVSWTVADNGTGSAVFPGTAGSQIIVSGPVFDTEQSFSMGAWVTTDGTTSAASGWQTVVAQRGQKADGAAIEYDPTANRWAFDMPESDTAKASTDTVLSKAAPAKATWYHLVATYDGGSHLMSFYLNGVLQGTSSHTVTWKATGSLSIGSGLVNGLSSNWLRGALSDVEVWNTALTPAGVEALH